PRLSSVMRDMPPDAPSLRPPDAPSLRPSLRPRSDGSGSPPQIASLSSPCPPHDALYRTSIRPPPSRSSTTPRVASIARVVRGSSLPAPAYTWHCCDEHRRNGSVRLRRPIFC